MPACLVTGANGFIGSHLVRELLSRGWTVKCLVRHTSDLSSLHGLSVECVLGDVRDPETIPSAVNGVEYVFHLAAELMATDRETFDQVIRQGTINMLEAATQNSGLKRFLYVSSQAAAGPGNDATPGDETKPRRPISWYGHAKAEAEDAVLSYQRRLPVTLVRPSGVYGKREKDVSQLYPLVENHLHPRLGILTKYVVLIYVEDLVRGIVEAAQSADTLGQTYFLNHPQVVTAGGVTETIARAMDKRWGLPLIIPIILLRLTAPMIEFIHQFTRQRPKVTRDKVREVAQRFWVSDPSKARRDFSWEAQFSLFEGMRKTVAAFRAEQAEIRAMPMERPLCLWTKYLTVAVLMGAMIEATSYVGHFYTFYPPWLVFVVIFAGFGFALGSIAMLLRKAHWFLQFVVGAILAFVAELLNVLVWHAWEFAPGWPFGIVDPWLRSAVLGLAGGAFVLVLNAAMRALYRWRLRMG